VLLLAALAPALALYWLQRSVFVGDYSEVVDTSGQGREAARGWRQRFAPGDRVVFSELFNVVREDDRVHVIDSVRRFTPSGYDVCTFLPGVEQCVYTLRKGHDVWYSDWMLSPAPERPDGKAEA
jgi:hypothetical protein